MCIIFRKIFNWSVLNFYMIKVWLQCQDIWEISWSKLYLSARQRALFMGNWLSNSPLDQNHGTGEN